MLPLIRFIFIFIMCTSFIAATLYVAATTRYFNKQRLRRIAAWIVLITVAVSSAGLILGLYISTME